MSFHTPQQDLARIERSTPTDRDTLPCVLLIGDSISQGYTPFVRERLAGHANVERPQVNCGDTRAGLEHLDAWLGGRHWDVIHFNWGLHDLCHRHPDSTLYGHRDKIKGPVSVSPEQYRANLERLVERLKTAATQCVWASTTVIPPDEAGRFEGDDLRYNAIAADVMQAHAIPTNDLYQLTSGFPPALFTLPGDVHFTEEGYRIIARQVADSIQEALPQP